MTESAAGPLDMLESLDEAGLHDVIRRAGELLKEREQSKRREAIEQARAILEGAGLSIEELMTVAKRPPGKKSRRTKADSPTGNVGGSRKGLRFANPTDPSQVYEPGRGRAPKWYSELKAKGELPAPLE